MDNDTLELAFRIAARGWKIILCRQDKKPCTPNGYLNATTSRDQIISWCNEYRDAYLIGIAMKPSGLVGVDVDDMNAWRDLRAFHSQDIPFKAGPMQNTPRRGVHMIFNYPIGIHVPNSAGALGKGIDLRSDGYLCTGPGYSWLQDHGIDADLTDLPYWLMGLIAALGKPATEYKPDYPNEIAGKEQVREYWLNKYLPLAIPGNRNEIGKQLALQLRDSGIPQSEAEKLPYPEMVIQGEKPYTRREWLATVRSIYKLPRRKPAKLPLFDQPYRRRKNGIN
ncbi:MAG TPA: bifunctional DNA primase/polymerase [Anaerolineaceae bacterium]|nr:bifunctional DNA primase/polymerase [Anaerolineaceae bacterium]